MAAGKRSSSAGVKSSARTIRRGYIAAAVITIIAIIAFALFRTEGPAALGPVAATEEHSNLFTARTKSANIEISFLSDRCARIHVVEDGKASPPSQATEGRLSRSVPFSRKKTLGKTTLSAGAISARIDHDSAEIDIIDRSGSILLSQRFSRRIADGVFEFNLRGSAPMYGVKGFAAGEASDEKLIRTGILPIRAGAQGSCGAPLVWTKGVALLADTDGGSFEIAERSVTLSGTSRSDLEYFVIAGTPFDIMKEVHLLSGGSPLFPKWSEGFINSEWGIDQKELLDHVRTYREKKIPLDAFILDFDWKSWGEDGYGEWRWNPENFPDGASGRLARKLEAQGVTLGGIFKPRIHVGTEQGRYAQKHGFFWPGKKPYPDYFSQEPVNDLNFAIPECRQWFWLHLVSAYDAGMRAYWNDEADEGFDNREFMNMQRALYEGQRSHDERRVWSINRNFYTGNQRFAYALWSGDIQSTWKSMKSQRERLLSAVNLGMMRWGMDTGGFNGTPDPENYARWVQFSAFCPVFRVHGSMDVQRQPWFYEAKAEKAAAEAVRLRYSLLPYIYSYEKLNHDDGVFLVRPFLWNDMDSAAFHNYIDGWFFGDFLAVFPIVDKGAVTKEIVLPEGEWYDFFDGKPVRGGKHTIDCDSENWSDIPLFIKEGAIIPNAEPVQSTAFARYETLRVDVFPSEEETSFRYYDDDGVSYQADRGAFFLQTISVRRAGKGARLTLSESPGTITTPLRHYLFRVYRCQGTPQGIAKTASLDELAGKDEGFCPSRDARGEYLAVKVRSGGRRVIEIR